MKIESLTRAKETLVQFLTAKERNLEMRFSDGYYMRLKKHVRKGKFYLDVYTPEYDESMMDWKEATELCVMKLHEWRAYGFLA